MTVNGLLDLGSHSRRSLPPWTPLPTSQQWERMYHHSLTTCLCEWQLKINDGSTVAYFRPFSYICCLVVHYAACKHGVYCSTTYKLLRVYYTSFIVRLRHISATVVDKRLYMLYNLCFWLYFDQINFFFSLKYPKAGVRNENKHSR